MFKVCSKTIPFAEANTKNKQTTENNIPGNSLILKSKWQNLIESANYLGMAFLSRNTFFTVSFASSYQKPTYYTSPTSQSEMEGTSKHNDKIWTEYTIAASIRCWLLKSSEVVSKTMSIWPTNPPPVRVNQMQNPNPTNAWWTVMQTYLTIQRNKEITHAYCVQAVPSSIERWTSYIRDISTVSSNSIQGWDWACLRASLKQSQLAILKPLW